MNTPKDFPPIPWPSSFTEREKDLTIERICIETDGSPVSLGTVYRHIQIIRKEMAQ